MVVCYGHSGKELDDSRITIRKQNTPARSYAGKFGVEGILGASHPVLLTRGRGSHPPTQQLVVIASYVITIRLVCGGSHAITLKFGGSELNHSFAVVGKPWHGSQVRKGPDWKPHLSALPHPYTQGNDRNVIGTVHCSGGGATARRNIGVSDFFGQQMATGFGVRDNVSPQAASVQESPGTVNVNEGSGFVGQYKWGKDDKYEIELA